MYIVTHSRQLFSGFEAGYGHGIGRTILVNGYVIIDLREGIALIYCIGLDVQR